MNNDETFTKLFPLLLNDEWSDTTIDIKNNEIMMNNNSFIFCFITNPIRLKKWGDEKFKTKPSIKKIINNIINEAPRDVREILKDLLIENMTILAISIRNESYLLTVLQIKLKNF